MKNLLKLLAAHLKGVPSLLAPVRKSVGTALGGATGVGVAEVLDAVGVHVATPVAAALALVLATVGTYLAPSNKPTAKAPASVAEPTTVTAVAPEATPTPAPVETPAPEVTNG
ncbi:hypothetical protein AB0383_20680 [Amycolatopsis sp. NPDC051373]|uniref:hypothetical protein n=1 Tax=Amycolatopsis sp. NPDC051373 TaxID=3155801 RepID=UPI00344E73C5